MSMPDDPDTDTFDWGDNVVAPFNYRVREVLELSDLMDHFDLISADQDSCMRFRALRESYVAEALRLVELIEEHAPTLRDQLKALLNDS